MGCKSSIASAFLAAASLAGSSAHAQCSANNYVHDGAPSSQRDCQPIASLKMIDAAEMSSSDADTIASRRADMQQAMRFYGAEPDAPGWTYQQANSPLLHHHVLLVYSNAASPRKASRLIVIVPSAAEEKVQVVPAFERGLNPYLPGWNAKGSHAVYNRLLASEVGRQPLSIRAPWLEYALLYLTLAGREPAIPTQTDSVIANWNLTLQRASTPVILEKLDGSAVITLSDTSSEKKSITWILTFNKTGQLIKVDKSEASPRKTRNFATIDQTNYELSREAEHREARSQ